MICVHLRVFADEYSLCAQGVIMNPGEDPDLLLGTCPLAQVNDVNAWQLG